MPIIARKSRVSKKVDFELLPNPADVRNLLDGVSVPAIKYGEGDVDCGSFKEWGEKAARVSDPDQTRLLLYFGFQPLYDVLIESLVKEKERTPAVKALNEIIKSGIAYLTGYYTGRPDPKSFAAAAQGVSDLLPDAMYKTKARNIDQNHISANDVLMFLRKFATAVQDGSVQRPDVVVGCACGSAEIAMPLAGVLGAKLKFMRRSHRRYDTDARILKEHQRHIGLQGKNVLVVEDYVVSGASLGTVMKKVLELGASTVTGASVNCPAGPCEMVSETTRCTKFHIYKLET